MLPLIVGCARVFVVETFTVKKPNLFWGGGERKENEIVEFIKL